MPDDVVRLSFPAKADYLLLARLALSGLARGLPIEDEVLADLKLAVTEACGNAAKHAYPDAGSGDVSVSYLVAPDAVELIVEDQGVGFDVATAVEPVGTHESGMGMSIMRAIADELDIRPGADGCGTVVRMVKRLGT